MIAESHPSDEILTGRLKQYTCINHQPNLEMVSPQSISGLRSYQLRLQEACDPTIRNKKRTHALHSHIPILDGGTAFLFWSQFNQGFHKYVCKARDERTCHYVFV